jgi:dihydrofolate reductase
MSGKPKIALVVAMARDNRVIGKDGGLPWRIPGDMKFFKTQTMGKPIVMGRKTFQSIGKPLPGRSSIVVTRDQDWTAEGVEVCHSVEEALALGREIARRDRVDEVCVIGGAEIYAQALPHADIIYLTEVAGEVAGDTKLMTFDSADWNEVSRTPIPDTPKATHKAELVELRRR